MKMDVEMCSHTWYSSNDFPNTSANMKLACITVTPNTTPGANVLTFAIKLCVYIQIGVKREFVGNYIRTFKPNSFLGVPRPVY